MSSSVTRHSWSDANDALSSSSSSSSNDVAVREDPEDEPLPPEPQPELQPLRGGLVSRIIEDELHTDDITTSAVIRVEAVDSEGPSLAPEIRTGWVHARLTEDWTYGVNRETVAPLRSGLNFSYNALVGGTGVDERALPKFMQRRLLKTTETVVKERRLKAKARSAGVVFEDARSRAIDEAIGLVRDPPPRASAGRGRGRGRFFGGRGRGRI